MLINFDFDGVIVDSFYQLLDLTKEAQSILGEGRIPVETDFTECENLTHDVIAEQLGISPGRIPEYVTLALKLQNSDTWNPPLFPGIYAAFSALSHHHTLAIITASSSSSVLESLKQYGIEGFVSHISGGELGLAKAERIRHSCAINNVNPDSAFMVGDTIGDIRQGQAAEVKTIAVTWGYQSYETLSKENPDFIIDSTDSLLSLFGNDMAK